MTEKREEIAKIIKDGLKSKDHSGNWLAGFPEKLADQILALLEPEKPEQMYQCPKWETCKYVDGCVGDHKTIHRRGISCDVYDNYCPACQPVQHEPAKGIKLTEIKLKSINPPSNTPNIEKARYVEGCQDGAKKQFEVDQAEANRQLEPYLKEIERLKHMVISENQCYKDTVESLKEVESKLHDLEAENKTLKSKVEYYSKTFCFDRD